jgi:hypothetical protein
MSSFSKVVTTNLIANVCAKRSERARYPHAAWGSMAAGSGQAVAGADQDVIRLAYCDTPSTAKMRSFPYLSPILRASR